MKARIKSDLMELMMVPGLSGHEDLIRDEIRKLEASELEISLNPKINQYKLKNKVYPKGRSTMGMPGTKPRKAIKKWKPKK